ncbi:unnamed protein product [Parnassius mnemosyne]|uniref:Uncharacterized protein n=1 Tax=Parnassius mnemosyne TaxID=213953 RepID=A0AAV1KN35_9NEOP
MYFLRFVVAAFLVPAILCYDAEYDKLDTDKILADDALFSSYIDCFLDKVPCTAEYSSEFKKILPEVIKESCGKCSPLQKQNVRKIVKTLFERMPENSKEFKKKYDPNGEYEADFMAFVNGAD